MSFVHTTIDNATTSLLEENKALKAKIALLESELKSRDSEPAKPKKRKTKKTEDK